jgi:hypothetical protein
MAANVGGAVRTELKTFDIEAAELEAYLRYDVGQYVQRQVIGVEVVRPATHRSIRQIIEDAGGPTNISGALDSLSVDAVYKWQNNGIPDRYWSVIIPLADSSPEEMFAANEDTRASE